MMKSKKMRQILPLFVAVPYIAYVVNDRMGSHHERRKEIDEAREFAKAEKAQQQQEGK